MNLIRFFCEGKNFEFQQHRSTIMWKEFVFFHLNLNIISTNTGNLSLEFHSLLMITES